jgi:hypothetical protein
MNGIKRMLTAMAIVPLCIAAQTITATASTSRPMVLDACGTNGDGAYNCMYINGSNHTAVTQVRGWSDPGANFIGVDVYEEVTFPDGDMLCQTNTVNITSASEVVGCELAPGGVFPIPPGRYCATLWNSYFDGAWTWRQAAQNCGSIN